MKKVNLIERLLSYSHEKQSPQRFGRYAVMLIMLLTLGVGQMWAGAGYWGDDAVYLKYWLGGDDINYYHKHSATSTKDLGTVTSFYLKHWEFRTWKDGSGNICDYGRMYYRIYLTSASAPSYSYWSQDATSWDGNNQYHYDDCNNNILSGLVGGVYYFEYYFVAQGNTSSSSGCGTNITSNTFKLQFKYDPKYTVTVSAGSNGSVASTSVTAGNIDAVTLPTATANTGYHFNNWTTASSNLTLGNTTSATTGTVKARAAGTVTANFAANTYTVAYNANDAQYPGTATGSTSSSSHTYGTAKALTSNGFSRTGYSFAGWATTPTGSVAYSDGQSVTNLSSTQGATVTLYAKWTENMSDVSLVASPTGKGSFTIGGAAATSTTAGVTTTRSVTAVPISGYRFSSWSISGGASISSTSTNPTTVTGGGAGTAATLTATFVEDITYYTLNFGARSGETTRGSATAVNSSTSAALTNGSSYISGTGVTVTANVIDDDYKFDCWYNAASGGSVIDGAGNPYSFTLTSNKKAYAHFVQKTTTVTINRNGGSGGSDSFTATHGSTLPSFTMPARSGYTLTGLWTESSGGTKIVNADKTLVASVTDYTTSGKKWDYDDATLTLYAQWTENMTTVTVNVSPAGTGTLTVGGAAFTPGNTTTAGKTTSRTVVATAANDYAFSSWSVTGNATGTNSTNTYTLKGNGSAGTGTLTANFTQVPCTLWYHTSSATFATKTGQIIMSYDTDEHAYYADVASTPSSPYYFRFYHNGATQYSAAWDGSYPNVQSAVPNGSKITCDQNVNIWGSKSSIQYVGNSGTSIRIWFDYQNKKAWITADKDNQYVLRGYKYDDSGAGGMPGWSATTTYFDGLASGNTGTITATLNAATKYKFKVYDRFSDTWYGYSTNNTEHELTDGVLSTTGTGTNNNFYFTTTIAGTYTFTVDKSSGLKVKVDYPVSYQLNYDIGTVKGTSGSISTDPTTASGSYVPSGNSVELTAPEAKSGYTWKGWYTNAAGTEGKIADVSRAITVTMNADKTLYACYTEDMHTVTLNSTYASGHVEIGGETVTSTSAGIATASPTITAVPELGYYFTGWTGSDINNGVTIASGSTSTASITIRATADSKSITANFARRWVLAGDWLKDGGGQWDHTTNTLYPNPAGYGWVQISNLAANTEYAFKLYDNTGATHWVGYASSGQVYDYDTYRAVAPADSILVNTYSGNAITLKTAAKGNYSFYYNFNTHKLYVYFPQSRKISMGVYTKSDGTSSAYTGGTISAVDNDENVITDGLYVSNNGSVTFTATPKAGYIWRGWYSNIYCTGDPVATERTHTVSSITSDVIRYALFEETLYSVKVHRNDAIETTYKVGIDSHPTINAATAPTGKIFDRWVTTGSATVEDPYASTTKITGATDDASTVTATFKDLPKIYIDMTSATGWNPSNMYVVFYKNGGYFDGTNGTGLSSTYVITPTPLEMTRMGTSKIWYYSYDPTSGVFEGETITCVAFVDHTFAANTGNFSSATVTYRTDFSSCMNMFVVTDDSGTNKNTTCYYRNTNAIDGTKGYWRKYEENNSGFYLNNLPGGSVEFTNEDGGNTYTARVNLDANTTYYFYLGCCNGWNWSNDQTTLAFNSDNRTRMVQPYNDVSSDGLRCKLTTTAAGYYTFSLTPQNTRQVQLSVDFPVAANDYRAVYNNAASSPTISRPSNIIKSDQNSGTISLWLNKGTNYISFQKATLGAGGAVSWTACGSQQTVTGVAEAGIYTMTLTRNGSTYTVSTPEKYDGDLYIRTDCAPGKWADYTENKLDENTFNFSATDPNTFDYYYCKWINDAGTNVRCVIANDINVALSDTLKGESILVSVAQPSNETLPEGANVRFSYNSVTNTLKRSYLTGSATDVFLNIIPDAASKVYKTDGTTDMYGSAAAKNKFSDLGNWVYVLNAKVKPGATAAVKANYNSTSQELIAEETTLLGGTEDVLYEIRLIYDFKTNYLMSAWMPSGNVDEAISLNSDIMIVRRGQNDANQLSFSDDGELTDVKRAYGVFEFRKTDMVGYMNSWSDLGYTYGLCMYYFSLPFDVNVSDIFGVGTMGDDWRIQFYNGKKRAEKGWFAGDGTTTFWEDVPADTVLYAYEGYLLMLNRSHFNNGSHKVWNNVTTSAYLYFPSTEPVYALDSIEKPITVPSHECTIDRFFTQDSLEYYDSETKQWKTGARNHKYVDSHWNMMGTPLFRNKAAKSIEACKVKIGEADSTLNYVYEWVPSTNSLSARQVLNTSFTFKPMFAYMVQYAGKVTFEGAAIKPAEIAARRSSEHKQYTVELELTKENQFAGRTYIELRENAVDSFMLNEDMYIMKGSKVADIYTHADGYELAANVLTINSHIVPVSVDTKSAGTYTFSMPSNFSGTVILIDKYANTRVNLAYEDYEVYLEQGAIKDRFEVEININDAPTAIDGAADGEGTLKDGKAHKFIMNDMMYILKDGVLYDAQGKRVK